ncbi:hypothetical protein LTR36_005748 [Oleoguttula mirabilis]|uniref:Zn(2)-C6 fungal-type domain-containing protein n=1 Tax=Oleoguttula mirabilis TaxID=1507867 RepID=A0AAV9JE98_9PEZI|nr:hypothetical protein LTR36_005748 [Oleoguttula mirabilis]
MVYRGRPSAGCEQCRKAKKRCTLEHPSCERCVKLRKPCSGYRDTTQLQIQDETEAVQLKANRQQAKRAAAATATSTPAPSTRPHTPAGILTPATSHADSSSSSDDTIDLPRHDDADSHCMFGPGGTVGAYGSSLGLLSASRPIVMTLRTTAEDIAMTHFFNQFTANGHWEFLRGYAKKSRMDPCLDLALRACGMAALDNVESVVRGRDYAQTMYVEALGLLNAALRDPKRCRTDESLIAVAMLGYYENLTCESRESISNWKAHIAGATQLLKIRGKEQFQSQVGRMLFRETRAQILIHCIWDDLEPPAFLWAWNDELEKQTTEFRVAQPADSLAKICFDFAIVRSRMCKKTISDAEAADQCSEIDRQMIQWSIDAMSGDSVVWQYYDMEVTDSPHVWNGVVHAYTQHPAPGVWNTYRSIRIMVTRSQEQLCGRFPYSDAERDEQTSYFRKVRRQMTDEICAGTPSQLGHASPAYNSPCVLISAYTSIWPLFFAGTCALERVGSSSWTSKRKGTTTASVDASKPHTSYATAQAAWIISRLEYISKHVGLHWASGIAAVLKGDFAMHEDLLPTAEEMGEEPEWIRKLLLGGDREPKVSMEMESDAPERHSCVAGGTAGPLLEWREETALSVGREAAVAAGADLRGPGYNDCRGPC